MTSADAKFNFRASASIILAAPVAAHQQAASAYDYQVLLLKRSESTAYAKDHIVFPGGAFAAEADEHGAWLEHFATFGIEAQQILEHFAEVRKTARPYPLQVAQNGFSRDISLRLTAIRETFEEVGLLLCRDSRGSFPEDFAREAWQQAVHEDPKQFLKLCQKLRVFPDLFALHEWSVWRSPTTATRKFDTVYYFVALERQEKLLLECSEVAWAKWETPSYFLQQQVACALWLPPTIYYELVRLSQLTKYATLLEFARTRSQKGSTLIWPVYYRGDGLLIGALPGDDLYPKEPLTCTKILALPSEKSSMRKMNFHRLLMRGMHNFSVQMNISPIDGHLSPVLMNPSMRQKL